MEVESLELYLLVGKVYNLMVDVGHTFSVDELKTWVHKVGPCDITGKIGSKNSLPARKIIGPVRKKFDLISPGERAALTKSIAGKFAE